ncbi:NAD(FAD)-dependent dehydrogenase [Thioflavicoccus mobilis 8321]|uniref:NAD(FAD)-dependent dehydrogenase n=1 Tax=Thioflavicoccus mobilis 8321 TaxID=765912 RepID=L0GW63_9GAMM|nr:NAD(P)/FAD-dependent oxidoreductase [Thioflavicoccus mobilis]AGA90983.1 NAD(FAD)-dependent dehydrogenase [Thioflavicoccus mobilis 8321]
MPIDRRDFIKAAGAIGLIGRPALALGNAAKVVVVGGGTGGATAAKTIKRLDPKIEVTLIEPAPHYYTCYMSNEVLDGSRTLKGIQVSYDGLERHGIRLVHDRAAAIDPDKRLVRTANGPAFAYDRCIVAPGIDFRYEEITGYDETASGLMPHAWKAGAQTHLLRAQLEAMADGGTVVIATPPNPFRCPAGPYERASLIAGYLERHKPRSKVLVLNAEPNFVMEPLFVQAWERLYGYGTDKALVEWLPGPGARVTRAEPEKRLVETQGGDQFEAAVVNLIPPQRAGTIARLAGLTDESGWCPVDLRTFESRLHQGIHVIGDACIATTMPKSGSAANSHGKVAAGAIVALLAGREPPVPIYANTCYSIVGEQYGISTDSVYKLAAAGAPILPVPGGGGVTPLNAPAWALAREVEYAHGWYNNLVSDSFG